MMAMKAAQSSAVAIEFEPTVQDYTEFSKSCMMNSILITTEKFGIQVDFFTVV